MIIHRILGLWSEMAVNVYGEEKIKPPSLLFNFLASYMSCMYIVMILNDWLDRALNWAQFNGALIKSSPQFVVWDLLSHILVCLFLSICPSAFFFTSCFDDCSVNEFNSFPFLTCCLWMLAIKTMKFDIWTICDAHEKKFSLLLMELNF